MPMNVVKNRVLLKKITKDDDSFVKLSPEKRVSFMWELTEELWSLAGNYNAEQRLQRNITRLIKKQG